MRTAPVDALGICLSDHLVGQLSDAIRPKVIHRFKVKSRQPTSRRNVTLAA